MLILYCGIELTLAILKMTETFHFSLFHSSDINEVFDEMCLSCFCRGYQTHVIKIVYKTFYILYCEKV